MNSPINSILEKIAGSQQFTQHFLENRQLFLWGTINDGNARKIVDALMFLHSKDQEAPITIHINSEIGSFTAAMVIIDTIKLIKTPVHTVAMGLASSAGALIFSAGDQRMLYPNTQLMVHPPEMNSAFKGSIAGGRKSPNHIKRLSNFVAETYAQNCKQTVENVMTHFNENRWLNATEAIEFGIADGIVEAI